MVDDKNTIPERKASIGEWIEANWPWIAAHIFNLLYALINSPPEGGIQILSVVIFMCIIFVQIYTDPIKPLPLEGSDPEERNKIEEKRSQQRNKWMKFAYSFMLLSLFLTFYPFINPLFSSYKQPSNKQSEIVSDKPSKPISDKPSEIAPDKQSKPISDKPSETASDKQYLKTLRERPIAVFIGCTLDSEAKNLRCEFKDKSQPPAPIAPTPAPDAKPAPATAGSAAASFGYAWVINIGGYVKKCTNNEDEDGFGKSVICEVKDGLLVPLYFIIMALMGGSISLTRRLPELQKQAGSEHIATEKQPKLSQYEFREHLIFQMVQFISAPFLAILAYYLIEPSNTTNAVVLAFTAGFASETILLMVRSIANKITPENNAAPQYGAVTGVVTWNDKDPSLRKPAEKIEVSLSGSPQIQSITDAQGFYILGNVPVGDHSILFTSTESVETKEIVKIDRAQAIIKKNITIEKKA
ncbi:hypothetical protein Nit79A3_3231 [Nitrosomonas sp. Is79A3]|uniref:hypothetical protein n=1 Tax=Nitrosomonas sp. (strain Is79A3) TaxID=261292 RepID=UPI000215CE6C